MKDRVTKNEVSDFKNKWCNENQLITEIIANDIKHYFVEPILDVGAGLGDIAYNVLREKRVICIDVNRVTKKDYPISANHQRLQIDFFVYQPVEKINTIFISHTLQFLDEDIELLNRKIRSINPLYIILVLNKNNDLLGKIIKWSDQHFANPNPELKISHFPLGYQLHRSIDFKALLICNSFNDLATQISYLMLIDLNNNTRTDLIRYLKTNLSEPKFEFNQVIEIYKTNERE